MSFYRVARTFVKVLSYVFYPIKVHGNVNDIPNEGAVILCANHLSYLDAVFLGIICKREIRFVAKEQYANAPVLKHIIKWLGAFGINPESSDFKAIKKCFRVIKSGEILGIFPEGTRIIGKKISNPMPGALLIAHKSSCPLFYIRIKPKHGKFKIFTKTDIYIGKSVTATDLGVITGKGDEYKNASIELLRRIYALGE